jgi:hypothetical protein
MYLLYAGQDLEELFVDRLSSGCQDGSVFFGYQEVSAESVQDLLLRFHLLPLGYEAGGFFQHRYSLSVGSFNVAAHIRAVSVQATDSSPDAFKLLVKLSSMFFTIHVPTYFRDLTKVLDDFAIALDNLLLHI